ncbi:uncharacterized protein LOC130738390 isoform X2 [Lotus japonicus]|uniref:uncharacterized protein LOC130738390 isoform X2 n=1 Tax=Lotus japonicus TaxID=34305 RepID=UPI00258408FA|nr:uncharacterized protein LOC130738390 isoform X2 [Lotus japonicus]
MLTHKKRKDGRPLDEESAKTVDMIQEKLNNGRTSSEQSDGSVAWKGDVYTQVFGLERSGYVRGLGLGPTPSTLWGTKSLSGNASMGNISNYMVQNLEQEMQVLKEMRDEEIKQMKELKKKHDEDMNMMKYNQEKLLSELSYMRQVMFKFIPMESSMLHNFSRSSFGQVPPDANNGHEQAPQAPSMSS